MDATESIAGYLNILLGLAVDLLVPSYTPWCVEAPRELVHDPKTLHLLNSAFIQGWKLDLVWGVVGHDV